MAKVRRFSGDVKMELSYNDRTNKYKVKLCPVRPLWKGKTQTRCETVHVGPALSSRLAVDAPRAYDQVARAALSFSKDDTQQHAQPDRDGVSWAISRGRRRRVKGLKR